MPYADPAKKAEYNRKYKEKNRDAINARMKEYQYSRPVPKKKPQSKEYARAQLLKRNYGITLEQYQQLLDKQDNKCYICQRPADSFNKSLAVDHDHKTLEIRGLLCTHCNRSVIGRHRDPSLFHRAHLYLSGPFPGWLAPGNRKRKTRRKKRI